MKKVLVTGATGFCGNHLCRLLKEKKYDVTGTFLKPYPSKTNVSHRLIPLDVRNSPRVDRIISTLKPDYICHLAAQSVPRFSWESQDETFTINTAGTINLLNAIRQYSPKTVLLHVSTIQVYGLRFLSGEPVREKDSLWPIDPYSASKAVSEFACLDFADRFGVQVIITRAFNHLGAGQPMHYAFSDWCRQIALAECGRKRPVLKVGNLDNRLDVLHVKDVTRAYEILMRKGKAGKIYNICSGNVHLLEDYVSFLLGKARLAIKVEIDQKRIRRNVLPVMKGDASWLRSLGWQPVDSPFCALEELLEEWRTKVKKKAVTHG